MNLTIPSRDWYLTGPNLDDKWEAPWNELTLCAGIDGATLCDGRTCWNVATIGGMCRECHEFATTNADYINDHNTTKP